MIMSLQEAAKWEEMLVTLRLAVVAVPMGLLMSRSMAWMSSGKTHPELVSRLRGKDSKLQWLKSNYIYINTNRNTVYTGK